MFADVTGDGFVDAIAINSNGVSVSVNDVQTPFFGQPTLWLSSVWLPLGVKADRGVFFANVNAGTDDCADLIEVYSSKVVVALATAPAPGFPCNGFGVPSTWISVPYYGDVGTFFADVNQDGSADAIVSNSFGNVTVRTSLGNGFGGPVSMTTGPFTGTDGLFFVDLNDDQRADGVAIRYVGLGLYQVVARMNVGATTLGSEVNLIQNGYPYVSLQYPHQLDFADIDGNGRPDLVDTGFSWSGGFVQTYLTDETTALIAHTATTLTTGPYFGDRGTFYGHVTDDVGSDKADGIVSNTTLPIVFRASITP